MQYAAVLLSTLATTALTAPLNSRQTQAGRPDNGIQIVLENADTHLTSTHNLQGDENLKLETSIPGQQSFTSINVLLGNNIKNKDLRCEALDENHKPIAGKRGENLDVAFSDGQKGAWTFLKQEAKVIQIVCSPLLKKTSPEALAAGQEVFVNLRRSKDEHHPYSVGPFTGDKREQFSIKNNQGEYLTDEFISVEISVGKFGAQDIRCALLDHRGRPVEAKRGQNIDTTFSDADKGEWDFLVPEKSVVYDVICDPKFKSAAGS